MIAAHSVTARYSNWLEHGTYCSVEYVISTTATLHLPFLMTNVAANERPHVDCQ